MHHNVYVEAEQHKKAEPPLSPFHPFSPLAQLASSAAK